MKKVSLLLTGFIFLLTSCHNDDDHNDLFNAVVIGKGLDCGDLFLIKFNDDIAGLPNSVDNIYYELNLPDKLKVEGKEIKVEFRKLKESEYFPCTTLGTGYSAIYIISATDK